MTLYGTVVNVEVALDPGHTLPDGTRVLVYLLDDGRPTSGSNVSPYEGEPVPIVRGPAPTGTPARGL